MNKITRAVLFFACINLLFFSCKTESLKNEVNVYFMSDAEMFNPIEYHSGNTAAVFNNLFQQLLNLDFKTKELVPVLAEAIPEVKFDSISGITSINYTIRKEAQWDNGDPVTGYDVEFTLKAIKCPGVDDERLRPYYEFISDLVVDPKDPKKFVILCNKKYFLCLEQSGDYFVLPQYNYDREGLLKNISLKEMGEHPDQVAENPMAQKFAASFNSVKFKRDPADISGSGAYKLDSWTSGQSFTMKRKDSWWGDHLNGTNCFFAAYPAQLNYKVIFDQTVAIQALKGHELDVMAGIRAKDFVEMKEDKEFQTQFNIYTPNAFYYSFIAFNTHDPKFTDSKVRQALAHSVDVDRIIKQTAYGMAIRTVGPISPTKKGEYNDTLKPFSFDLELAKKMLSDAGWNDSNGDGTLDKIINGKRTEFHTSVIYLMTNEQRRDACLIWKEDLKKIGIQLDLVPKEKEAQTAASKNHEFELLYNVWMSSSTPLDPKQLWSTSSANGGDNLSFFGNAESDQLIENIRQELDPQKRNDLYRQFQVIIHQESPYIFLSVPTERIVISKKFPNAEGYELRPGYWESGLKMSEDDTH